MIWFFEITVQSKGSLYQVVSDPDHTPVGGGQTR